MSEISEKQKKINIQFLCNCPLFKGIDTYYFYNKYYNLLVENKVKKTEKIIEFEDPSDNIIIVKNGEFKVSIRMNLSEIDKFIVKLQPEYKNKIKTKISPCNYTVNLVKDNHKKVVKNKHIYTVINIKC